MLFFSFFSQASEMCVYNLFLLSLLYLALHLAWDKCSINVELISTTLSDKSGGSYLVLEDKEKEESRAFSYNTLGCYFNKRENGSRITWSSHIDDLLGSHGHSNEPWHRMGDDLLTIGTDLKPFKVFCGKSRWSKNSIILSKSDWWEQLHKGFSLSTSDITPYMTLA